MNINGREIKFLRSVGATMDIADLCPNGDISKIQSLFTGKFRDAQINTAKFIIALNNGYENAKKYEDENYIPNPLKLEELINMPHEIFNDLLTEATEEFSKIDRTVETEDTGKKTKELR